MIRSRFSRALRGGLPASMGVDFFVGEAADFIGKVRLSAAGGVSLMVADRN
jgi:hypothetical protein